MNRVRFGIVFALFLSSSPLLIGWAQSGALKLETFDGTVVPLAELLDKQGVKLDADAAPYWVALVSDSGKVHPLVKDAMGRMYFTDKKLLRRPMRIIGRLVPGSDLLQAINVHSLKDGKLHDIYYWCEVCIIKGYESGACACCGAPMEFREIPVKK